MGQITEEKAQDHSKQADTPKLPRMHCQDLLQPALHGFGGGHVGQSLQNEDKTYEGDEKFHAPSITRKRESLQPTQSY